MDLYAYAQIENVEEIAKANNISVPRLRGYRLMGCEKPMTEEDIKKAVYEHDMTLCERACRSVPRFDVDSGCSEYSPRTNKIKKKYLMYETVTRQRTDGSEFSYDRVIGFRWDLLHGKNRKKLKFAIKKGRKDILKQLNTFNKYVGREDVLYIHARIGGGNWGYYGGEKIEQEPWFLEKVDDYFDCTYCDIYTKIDVNTIPKTQPIISQTEE